MINEISILKYKSMQYLEKFYKHHKYEKPELFNLGLEIS